jgi:hypothetical protein
LKLVDGASYAALNVILNKALPGHRISADTILHFWPSRGGLAGSGDDKRLPLRGHAPGTILLMPISTKWSARGSGHGNKVTSARGDYHAQPAFACTDYKVQGRTLARVALELRGSRTVKVRGEAVPSQCDPYSLYVQLSRCRSLDAIMLSSKARERDIVGNTVPENMATAEERLELLSEAMIREAETWDWSEEQ